MKKRDLSVELARIVACLMVVGVHNCLDYTVNGQILFKRLFVNTLTTPGVTIFWLITGFFIMNNDYVHSLKKTILKLWLPAIIISCISLFCYDLFRYLTGALSSLNSIPEYVLIFFKGIFSFRNFAPSSYHFWFIYIYLFVIIISPLLIKIISFIKSSKKMEIISYVLLIISLGINDYYDNSVFNFGQHYISGLIPASLFVIFGALIYDDLDEIINNRYINCVSLIALPILLVIADSYVIYYKQSLGISTYITRWFSLNSLLFACLIILLCKKVYNHIQNEDVDNAIAFLSKYTLYIYIFHPYILKIVSHIKIYNIYAELLSGEYIICELFFVVFNSVMTFLITLFICVLLSKLKGIYINIFNR